MDDSDYEPTISKWFNMAMKADEYWFHNVEDENWTHISGWPSKLRQKPWTNNVYELFPDIEDYLNKYVEENRYDFIIMYRHLWRLCISPEQEMQHKTIFDDHKFPKDRLIRWIDFLYEKYPDYLENTKNDKIWRRSILEYVEKLQNGSIPSMCGTSISKNKRPPPIQDREASILPSVPTTEPVRNQPQQQEQQQPQQQAQPQQQPVKEYCYWERQKNGKYVHLSGFPLNITNPESDDVYSVDLSEIKLKVADENMPAEMKKIYKELWKSPQPGDDQRVLRLKEWIKFLHEKNPAHLKVLEDRITWRKDIKRYIKTLRKERITDDDYEKNDIEAKYEQDIQPRIIQLRRDLHAFINYNDPYREYCYWYRQKNGKYIHISGHPFDITNPESDDVYSVDLIGVVDEQMPPDMKKMYKELWKEPEPGDDQRVSKLKEWIKFLHEKYPTELKYFEDLQQNRWSKEIKRYIKTLRKETISPDDYEANDIDAKYVILQARIAELQRAGLYNNSNYLYTLHKRDNPSDIWPEYNELIKQRLMDHRVVEEEEDM